MIWNGFYVFVAIFAADVFWTLYIQKWESRPVAAGCGQLLCLFPGALVTLSYVREPILLHPSLFRSLHRYLLHHLVDEPTETKKAQ